MAPKRGYSWHAAPASGAGAGAVDFTGFEPTADHEFQVGELVETLCKGMVRWVATILEKDEDGSFRLSGGITRRPDQLKLLKAGSSDVYTGLTVRVKGFGQAGKEDEGEVDGEEGVTESYDPEKKTMLVKMKTGKTVTFAVDHLEVLAIRDEAELDEEPKGKGKGKDAGDGDAPEAVSTSPSAKKKAGGPMLALPAPAVLAIDLPGYLQAMEMSQQGFQNFKVVDAKAEMLAIEGPPAAAAADAGAEAAKAEEEEKEPGEGDGGVGEDGTPDITTDCTVVGLKKQKTTACTKEEVEELVKEAHVKADTKELKDVVDMKLVIVGAKGLRNADWLPGQGKSDPYVICQIPGKPAGKFKTRVIRNNLNPVWNHTALLVDFNVSDTLEFKIYDRDWGKKDDYLGKCTVTPSTLLQFANGGFQADIPLVDAGKGIKAFLELRLVRLMEHKG